MSPDCHAGMHGTVNPHTRPCCKTSGAGYVCSPEPSKMAKLTMLADRWTVAQCSSLISLEAAGSPGNDAQGDSRALQRSPDAELQARRCREHIRRVPAGAVPRVQGHQGRTADLDIPGCHGGHAAQAELPAACHGQGAAGSHACNALVRLHHPSDKHGKHALGG